MKYDFDQIIDRRGTSCLKYDFAVERGKREDVLPLWVADMDFRVAEPILKRCMPAWITESSDTVKQRMIIFRQWLAGQWCHLRRGW